MGNPVAREKACPVVLRKSPDGSLSILAFKHPIAGNQLVKGSIEADESPDHAAVRELGEEAGITNAALIRALGVFEVGPPHQRWHAFLFEAENLPDEWVFSAPDDGGHDFRFFWYALDEPADDSWHLIFRQALEWLRLRLYGSLEDE